MVAPNTGSITTGAGGRNRTGTSVSTNIIMEVNGNRIGAIQSFDVKETRPIAMIDEVGSDGHVDSVPQKSASFTINCRRVRYDNLRILAAFSRPYIHVHAQRIPFDIVVKDIFAGDDPSTTITTTYKNCWVQDVGFTYAADNFVITETCTIVCETCYSTLGANNNAVPGAAGGRNLPIGPGNVFELEADRGDRRGSLDGAGLLLAVEEG